MSDLLASRAAPRPPLSAAANENLPMDRVQQNTTLLDDDRVGAHINLQSLTEDLAGPAGSPDGRPPASFIPAAPDGTSDLVKPTKRLLAWILVVSTVGLAGPIWAGVQIGEQPHDLLTAKFSAALALNLAFGLIRPLEVKRGKRSVSYHFSDVATLVSVALFSAPVAVAAGFIALTVKTTQEYLGNAQGRYRAVFNYGLSSLVIWVTVLVATSFHVAPWNYLAAVLAAGAVADACVAGVFKIAYQISYRTYFARDWAVRVGIPAVVALLTGTVLMIPDTTVAFASAAVMFVLFWTSIRGLLRVRSERANWANLDWHNSSLSGLGPEKDIARNTALNAHTMFPMKECALFIYPNPASRTGGYVYRVQGQGSYTSTVPYEETLPPSYTPPHLGVDAVVTAELAYAPLIAANRVLGHFEMRFASHQRRTKETAAILTHFLGNTSSTMMMARQHDQMRIFAESKAREAEQDQLTGLGNRTRLHRGGAVALRHARQNGREAALIMFDLDGFKRINDTLGHATGDQVLKVIADRITTVLGPHDVAARVGGDEFVVLAADLAGAEGAREYAEMILMMISQIIPMEGITLAVEASAGVAHVTSDANVAELLKRADVAVHTAKDHGRGVVEEFDHTMSGYSPEQLQLTADLHEGLDRQELVLHYQPQINLVNGKFAGVEALVRWQHPQRGLLYPDAFVPLAERSGMIRPFTLQILDLALRDFSGFRAMAIECVDPEVRSRWVNPNFTLSVNFSARNLLDLELPERVRERLEHYGVSPHRLIIEITESANVHDWASAERVMKALSEMGCLVSIDDFGTGYSSLQSLMKRKDTVSEVKIDRSFVGELVESSGSEFALCQAIVSMAHGTHCYVVAEGVELAESIPVLQGIGCDVGQGYFFARPMPMEAVLPWFNGWPQVWSQVG